MKKLLFIGSLSEDRVGESSRRLAEEWVLLGGIGRGSVHERKHGGATGVSIQMTSLQFSDTCFSGRFSRDE